MSIDIDSMPVVQIALRGNDLASLQSIAEDEIQPALERLDGVASVDISGGYEQEIAVHTDASRLKGYNLTISSIGQQLGADNIAIPGAIWITVRRRWLSARTASIRPLMMLRTL